MSQRRLWIPLLILLSLRFNKYVQSFNVMKAFAVCVDHSSPLDAHNHKIRQLPISVNWFRVPFGNHRAMELHCSKSNTGNLVNINSLDQSIIKLKRDREQRKLDLLASEIALLQAERDLLDLLAASNSSLSDSSVTSLSLGYDYGFTSKSMGPSLTTGNAKGDAVPASAITLASKNFVLELNNILSSWSWSNRSHVSLVASQDPVLQKLSMLKLSNEAIWMRERRRPEIKAPQVIKVPYLILCWLLDILFNDNPIERFYFLETVARMPYFSYITMLHAYETLGWWRRSTEAKRVHFAEELNELNHLLIMISLGGDQNWRVRFLAQHAAIVYYFVLIGLWLASPTLAYNFSELIEAHAVDTYAEFAESNKDILMSLRAPIVAKEYYEASDMYIFDEFQTSRQRGSRRPIVNNLYDVFCNIRDDEAEHVKTMAASQDPDVLLRSPNTEAALFVTAVATAVVSLLSTGEGGGDIDGVVDSVASGLTAIGAGTSQFLNDLNEINSADVSDMIDFGAVDDNVASSMEKLPVGREALAKLASLFERYLKF